MHTRGIDFNCKQCIIYNVINDGQRLGRFIVIKYDTFHKYFNFDCMDVIIFRLSQTFGHKVGILPYSNTAARFIKYPNQMISNIF